MINIPTPSFGTKGLKHENDYYHIVELFENSNALIRHKRIETNDTLKTNSHRILIPTPSFGTKGLKQCNKIIRPSCYCYSNALIRHKRIETKFPFPINGITHPFQRPHSAQKDWNLGKKSISRFNLRNSNALIRHKRIETGSEFYQIGTEKAIPTPSFGTKGLKHISACTS